MLPYEVFEAVVEELANDGDVETLRELCVVSSTFVHLCRKHLFSKIQLIKDTSSP